LFIVVVFIIMAQILLAALEVVIHVWDFVSYPISWIVWRPWSTIKARETTRSRVRFGKDEIEFSSLPLTCRNREEVLGSPKKIDSVDKLFDRAVRLFGPNKCLGTRKIHQLLRVQQADDTVLTKLDLVG
jgi:hypothetical protein